MQKIVATTMLLRESVVLPVKLVTEAFQEGWRVVRSGDVPWLDKEIRTHGWHFVWITEALLRSGVGETSEAATAHAFKLALRRLDERFDGAQIAQIQLSKYPGLFIARIKLYPCQIQPGTSPSKGGNAASMSMPIPIEQRVLPTTQVAQAL
jgi:hypothetical protein